MSNGLLVDLKCYMKYLNTTDATGNFTFNTNWQGDGDGDAIYSPGGPVTGEGMAIAPTGHFPSLFSDQVGGILADLSDDFWFMSWFQFAPGNDVFTGTFSVADLVVTNNTATSDIYVNRGGAGYKPEWYYGIDYGVTGHQIGNAMPIGTWHQANYWWDAGDQALYMVIDGGSSLELAVPNANLLTPNSNNTLNFGFTEFAPNGPIALWMGKTPSNADIANIWNSAAGLPFSQFDSGGGGTVGNSPIYAYSAHGGFLW